MIDTFFSEKDLQLLETKNISIDQVADQINFFKKGSKFSNLVKACTPGDGILKLDEEKINQLIQSFEQKSEHTAITKFVPASGAASRMFKHLYEFLENGEKDKKTEEILDNLDKLAFHKSLSQLADSSNEEDSINKILNESGLNYGHLPKGLIEFHEYSNETRTPFHEQLLEGQVYAKSDDIVHIHFTVSPEHEEPVKKHIEQLILKYPNVKFDISFSNQQANTDTIAVDSENNPFRVEGELLFRPGGHGALIENLNNLREADLIYIKNIDNVCQDWLKETTLNYKKALGGYLLDRKDEVFSLIDALEKDEKDASVNATAFIDKYIDPSLQPKSKKDLIQILHRPIRVCGMVKNLGEPGGGPFWVKNGNSVTKQIVESSQIDLRNPKQKEILQSATHFNPVDLVCYTKDSNGQPFDLHDFVDHETCFISEKSMNGRNLKALELPGLWNGAMAKWITFFVEVPIETFNPVKTVNDLLRKEHQPK